MKPIAGSVVSSKPVSLSKAASILSRFAVSDTGAHQDVSAFLRRTSEAFDELARFHRDLGAQREGSGSKDAEEVERRKKERKKKEEAVVEAAQDGNSAEIEGKRKKKKRKEEAAVEAAQDGSYAEIEGDPGTSAGRHGGGALDLRESKSGSREKKRAAKETEGRIGNVVEMKSEKSNRTKVKRTKKEEDVKEGSGDGVENDMEHHHKKKKKVREES